MSRPYRTTASRLTCADMRFVEAEFPCPITPRLVLTTNLPSLASGWVISRVVVAGQNCRAQSREPEAYLIEVLKRLPHDEDESQAAALTPARIAREGRAAREFA